MRLPNILFTFSLHGQAKSSVNHNIHVCGYEKPKERVENNLKINGFHQTKGHQTEHSGNIIQPRLNKKIFWSKVVSITRALPL